MSTAPTNASRTIVLAVLSLIAAQLPLADAAIAEVKIVRMKHVSYDDLKSKCAAEGGEFDSVGKTDYWCSKGGSHVVCDTKNCTGATGTPSELNRRLQHLRDPASSSGTLTPQ